MKIIAAFVFVFSITGCVSGASPEEGFAFDQSKPQASGKSDEAAACGDDVCEPLLCGWDCRTAGEQAKAACVDKDDRQHAFVAGEISGASTGSFDSRTNPFVPVYSLDDVLVYGCDLRDLTGGERDGFLVQFEELIHASFTTSAEDPTRHGKYLLLYVSDFTGAGSYRAQARYRTSNSEPSFEAGDACAVDVDVDAAGTVSGRFDCAMEGVAVRGTFGCPMNAMMPIFSEWKQN